MSKKHKKTNVLANQKPKRRWSLAPRAVRRILLTLVLLLASATAFHYASRWVQNSTWTLGERPALQAMRGLSEDEQRSILEKYRQIRSASPEQLQAFSQELYKNFGLRSVQLIQTAPDRIAIATEPFMAELVIELDKLRYVTSDAIVFGQVPAQSEGAEYTVLRGLYKNLAGLRTENGTYLIGEANQRIVEDALLAIQEVKKDNIKYRSLTYDEFRGLSGDLLEPNYRITLGFKPFEDKYLKLQKIIESLKERGLQSATIELDYKGKAFIKETVF